MQDIEIVVVHGAPGSGKTTIATACAELLREAGVPHVFVDIDELARVYPERSGQFKWDNLAAIWPNYAALAPVKVILPVLLDTEEEAEALRSVVVPARLTVCGLSASLDVCKERVTEREPNDYWRNKLRSLVDKYGYEQPKSRFVQFEVDSVGRLPKEAASELLQYLGWLEGHGA